MTIGGGATVAGIIGWPVGHSRSPRLHGYWIERYGIDGAYVPLAVAPDNLAAVLRALPLMGIAGVNVTVPHKQAALAAVDRADATAARIGAVNTITVAKDGTLDGSNTDGFGFLENLRAGAAGNLDLARGPALVLGAGGAARAVVAALAAAGAPEIRIANRGAERAERLAAEMSPAEMSQEMSQEVSPGGRAVCRAVCRAVPWSERAAACDGAALLVNTTSLGMQGQPPLEIALDALPLDAVVNDIVYAPLETPLLAAARARGNPALDGLGMLLHQGRPGFKAWFGVDPEVTPALRAHVAGDLGAA